MKLYYKPSACSLASHILLREVGADFELERVDTARGITASGARYAEINPRGKVPALQVDGQQVLTEGAAILQYIADQHPDAGLSPAFGSVKRARLQQWLNFLASELHAAFRPFFGQGFSDAEKTRGRREVGRALDVADAALAQRPYLIDDEFSAADAYLFVMSRWTPAAGLRLEDWPNLAAFVERVGERDAVRMALAVESQVEAA